MTKRRYQDESELLAEAYSGIIADNNKAPGTKRSSFRLKMPSRRIFAAFSVLIGVALILISGIIFFHRPDTNQATAILETVKDFKPYYFKEDNLPEGTQIDTAGVTYSEGVLLIPVKASNGQVVSISQQPVPEEFFGTQPVGTEKIDIDFGVGALSNREGRTTVNIITNNGVFILINAPASVSADTVKSIARSLTNF